MLVTLHVPLGGTIKQLIGEVTELAGGVRPRTVSGRVGVLVDAELAYRYLASRYAPPAPPAPVAQQALPDPEPIASPVAQSAPVKKPPVKKTVVKNATPKGV